MTIIAPKHSCITISCNYLQFCIILENLLPLVGETVDSILVKEGRVEITFLFNHRNAVSSKIL